MSHQTRMWFTGPLKIIYIGLVLWSWTPKDPVNREDRQHPETDLIQKCTIKYWFNSECENCQQVRDNRFPSIILVRGGGVYKFDNIVRTPIHHQWSTSPYLQFRSARLPGHKLNMLTNTGGQIRAMSPGVFLCSWASSALTIQLLLSAPPFACYYWCSPNSVRVLTPYLLPSGCEVATFGNRWTNEEGGMVYFSQYCDWLPVVFLSMNKEKDRAAGQL